MNGMVLILIGAACFAVAYAIYARYLERLFGVDPEKMTPAHTQKDGVDYVPTRLPVLFGHHFASIAGAGPIVGPIAAAYMGWGPVALWVIFGSIFIGAMHDFAALFLSVRHEGRSIGYVIEDNLGFVGRLIFLVFCWVALVLVVAVFALLVAGTFVGKPAVATSSILFIVMAPVFGFLVYRGRLALLPASLIFVPLLFVSIWIGTMFPLDLVVMSGQSEAWARNFWIIVLFVYVFAASIMPVWMLLQPRDYLNSYLLYAMLIAGLVGIIVARPVMAMPAFVGWATEKPGGGIGTIFPILYVTVACGACSGFHALVSSGTTAKQISTERDMKPVGYGSMLVEGLVALMALISVAVLAPTDYAQKLVGEGKVVAFADGLASFTAKVGISESLAGVFFSLAISAFMLTTLDTATRLTRFTWQELFLPSAAHEHEAVGPVRKLLGHPVTATFLAVLAAGYLALSGNTSQIWPVFGASNQLLAALTLLVVTLWLVARKRNFWVALVPMVFMTVITVWALINLLVRNLDKEKGSPALVVATVVLLVMGMVLAVQSVCSLRRPGTSE